MVQKLCNTGLKKKNIAISLYSNRDLQNLLHNVFMQRIVHLGFSVGELKHILQMFCCRQNPEQDRLNLNTVQNVIVYNVFFCSSYIVDVVLSFALGYYILNASVWTNRQEGIVLSLSWFKLDARMIWLELWRKTVGITECMALQRSHSGFNHP